MFPAMYTHYYWEEKREEIYRSAPTRTRVSRNRRGGVRRARGRRQEREDPLECLTHGGVWAGHYDQLMEGLLGRVLPDRTCFKEELAATVCSCDDRDREKCRDAAARFGFTAGSNLPPLELNDRMRFTELYFHNILNSPQFTEDYLQSASQEDPVVHIVRGLHAARSVIYALVQRCVLNNDLKAYRLLDIIRLYTQKPNCSSVRIPLPVEDEAALEMLVTLEKGDHMSIVAKMYGCQVVPGVSIDSCRPTLDLNLCTANLNDVKAVEEYFKEPLGYKEPVKPEPTEASNDESPEDATGSETTEHQEDAAQSEPQPEAETAASPQEPQDEEQPEQSQSAESQQDGAAAGPSPSTDSNLQAEGPSETNSGVSEDELSGEATSATSSTPATSENSSDSVPESSGNLDSTQVVSANSENSQSANAAVSESELMVTDQGRSGEIQAGSSSSQTLPERIIPNDASTSEVIHEANPTPLQPNSPSDTQDDAMQLNSGDHLTPSSPSEILVS